MAFNPGGTNYSGFLEQRRLADAQVTKAKDAQGRAEKQARIKKSGERSALQKGISAVARGAAAYYTGGLSETMGGGDMIDSAMLGTDSEGNAVRNEYGDLVGVASKVYQGSKDMKAGKLGEQDARFDKLMDRRQKNVEMLFDKGMIDGPNGAMAAQGKMEDMRLKYDANRKDAEGKGWGGSGLGMSDEDYNIMPGPKHTPESKAAAIAAKNAGTGGSSDYSYKPTDMGDDQKRHGQMMPPTADAPEGPNITPQGRPAYETNYTKAPDTKSAALSTQSSHPTLQQQSAQEKEDLINQIKGGQGEPGRSDADVRQSRAIGSWMSTPLTIQGNQADPESDRAIKVTGKWGDKWKQRNAIKHGRVG